MQSSAGARAFQNARLQKKFKKQAEALISTANTAFGQGRHAEAEALCRQILNELPDHFGALHLLGLCAFSGQHFEAAKQALKHAVTVDPRSAQAFSDLGATHFALGQYEDARTYLEKAIALKPSFPIALANLGNALLHLNRVEQAIESYDRAIKLKPDYVDALCNRGLAELALRQFDRARQSFERALLFQPRHVEALVGKGLVNIELKNYEEARSALETALALRPGSAKILANRGRVNLELSRLDQAAADFDAALALSPKLEVALQGKAQVALNMGNTAQAILACTTLLEENPRSAVAMALLSACFANQGEIASAIELLDAAVAIAPDAGLIGRKIFFPLVRERLLARFVAHGIAEADITCFGMTPRHEHLRAFAQVDISLDPFPQNGGISTWESLYAGVPVVAKLGNASSSRAGASIVAAVGLNDWVAGDDDGYAAIACKFAAQPDYLAKLRAGLPARIAASPAGNGEIYAGRVEAAYRQFWRDYCAPMTA